MATATPTVPPKSPPRKGTDDSAAKERPRPPRAPPAPESDFVPACIIFLLVLGVTLILFSIYGVVYQSDGFLASMGLTARSGFPPTSFSQYQPEQRQQRTEDRIGRVEAPLSDFYTGRQGMSVDLPRNVICQQCEGYGAAGGPSGRTICPQCGGRGHIARTARIGGMMFSQNFPCDHCHGRGYSQRDCPHCHGRGLVTVKESVFFDLPAGAPEEYEILLRGKADEHLGREAGDLRLRIHSAPHRLYKRSGALDLNTTLTLSLVESLVGFSRVITLPDNSGWPVSRATITSPGAVLTEPKGLPSPATGDQGNLYIHCQVDFPRLIDPAKLAALRDLLRDVEYESS